MIIFYFQRETLLQNDMPGGGPQTIASPGPSASQALHTLKGPEFLLLLSFLDWGWVALNSPESLEDFRARRVPRGFLVHSFYPKPRAL